MQTIIRPGEYRFQLGDMTIATILDGYRQGDGPHPTFGANVDEAEVHALMRANFLPETRFEHHFVPILVETGGELVLFDTGFSRGTNPTAGFLQDGMKRLGHKPEDVTVVVITHGHGDHISGLMTDGKESFPNARYAIGQKEYDFWVSDEPAKVGRGDNAKMFEANFVPLVDRTTFLQPGDEVVPGITAVEAFGHSPGHLAFMLESGGKRLLHMADTTNHYVASLQRPDWHVSFDTDKEQAAATRRRIFEMAASERIPVTGFHMPFPSVGFVEKTADGYRWVPASYQMNL